MPVVYFGGDPGSMRQGGDESELGVCIGAGHHHGQLERVLSAGTLRWEPVWNVLEHPA